MTQSWIGQLNLRAITVIAVLMATIFACSSEPSAPPTPAPPTATPTPPTPTPEPIVMEFNGQGDSVVGPFLLPEGVVSYIARHSGARNFVVKFIGQNDELSINEIGPYQGARAHLVSSSRRTDLIAGEHRIEVTADGSWSLTMTIEHPTSGVAPPVDSQGRGDNTVSWLLLNEGTYTLSAKHSGSRNFIVRLLGASGRDSELFINEIGPYDGQKIIKVDRGSFGPRPGLYVLSIRADGDWAISID